MTLYDVTCSGDLEAFSSQELFRFIDDRVVHLSGERDVPCAANECVVLCVVRNGVPYIKDFLEHHLSKLNVRHLFFIDNGSTDDTRDLLSSHSCVSVFYSELPFGVFSHALSQFLVEKFGRNRWALVVDIDEFFDYPFSSELSLTGLLEYLNRNGYNVVVTQMLDLFSDRDLQSATAPEKDFRTTHVYYDIAGLETEEYAVPRLGYKLNNQPSNPAIKFLKGGIRKTVFGLKTVWLTKHALVKFGGEMSYPHRHIVTGGRAADISCVLYHYKFLSHFPDYVREVLRRQSHVDNSREYRYYNEKLENESGLNLTSTECVRLDSQEELIENGFIQISSQFANSVGACGKPNKFE